MIKREELVKYLEKILKCNIIKDYSPNGLQIQGKDKIKKIVTGVTANLRLIKKAKDFGADCIIVHHGFFWKDESQRITEMKYKRISMLIKNNINLLAYHLPLDVHEKLGNNIALANLLGLTFEEELNTNTKPNYGIVCKAENIKIFELEHRIRKKLNRNPLIMNAKECLINRVGICTGAGQKFIKNAFNQNVQVYISGEASEQTMHIAEELGITYICAGHHATERYGVQLLGEHLKKRFNIKHEFIDIDNPI